MNALEEKALVRDKPIGPNKSAAKVRVVPLSKLQLSESKHLYEPTVHKEKLLTEPV